MGGAEKEKDYDKGRKEKSQNGYMKFFARNNGAYSTNKRNATQEMER